MGSLRACCEDGPRSGPKKTGLIGRNGWQVLQ
jgi:hypothetical protein